ncbi:MAG: endonuclease I/subtilisin-like proprotein convertase family protein [Candidatus Endobugula sp.]|jgi:endonuclease I/subtilisin-like proprotein convertase family protein
MQHMSRSISGRNISRLVVISISLWVGLANAAIPVGYYDTADESTETTLRNSLHNIIKDHQRYPYTSTSTDTWDILETADQDPDASGNVITIYRNASYGKEGGGNTFYNREHAWPKSYGFPNDGSTNYPYTDTHHLFIADSGYNSSRSNKPYADCAGCSEKTTEVNNNRGGVDSNWTTGSFSAGSWETWNARKGDVARALLYTDVRYEGGVHGITGVSEPDLILTDDRALIDASNTGSNGTVAYMGLLSTLIQWHKQDPVDDFERRHTDTVYSFQGNRNPFIDHPEYVECVFENLCNGGSGDITPPSAPTNLMSSGGSGIVNLDWDTNTEIDLAGYNIYRSTTSGGATTKINSTLVSGTNYDDSNVVANTTYYYVITATDTSGNESTLSNEDFATPTEVVNVPMGAWINEFHYDNKKTDVGEFVEIAGNANLDLTGWKIIAYNGNGGSSYKTTYLSGSISDQENGYGTLDFLISGIQNGAPDGLALVDNMGTVVQFISYEGTFAATNDVANGMTSTNVGVSETSSTPVGYSLQLIGTGQTAGDFVWQTASADSPGLVNAGQSFGGVSPPQNQLPTAAFIYSCTGLSCSFNADSSSDPDGQISSVLWAFGDGSQGTNSITSYDYTAAGTYTVTLTVTDNDGALNTTSQSLSVQGTSSEPSFFENTTAMSIPDRSTITSSINVVRSGGAGTVDVSVNITHSYRGDINLVLIAPNQSRYTLKNKDRGDKADNIIETYTAAVSGNAQGNWTLEVSDNYKKDTGNLNSWSIQF